MTVTIGRRELLAALGGAAAAWPLVARARQGERVRRVGYLDAVSPDTRQSMLAAFRQALQESGYVEGKNLAIEYRWAEGHYDRLPALAADLVNNQVDVIVAIIRPHPASQQRRQPQRYQSFSRPAATRSTTASSPA